MKFKHFTMEELNEMTQDQQRGYVLAELIYGLGKALVGGMEQTEVYETSDKQALLVTEMEGTFKKAIELFKGALTADTEELEERLQLAVDAPKALNYK